MKTKISWYLLFTLPILLVFLVVNVIPFIWGLYYTMVEWNGVSLDGGTFVGFRNFVKIFSDAQFGKDAVNTVIYVVFSVVSVNILALLFALMVTSSLKGHNVARALLFMPYLIGGLILGYIWKYIYNNAFTAIGDVLSIPFLQTSFLLDKKLAMVGMILVQIWKTTGYVMIIFVTGLQAIPEELLEASRVDGVSRWQMLTKIKIPLLMPSITISLFITLAGTFKEYDTNLSLTGGGPNKATEMLAMNIFQEIFSKGNYGYGQAKAVFFFVCILAVTIVQVLITKRREVEMQ